MSLIFATATRIILPVLLLFSIFILIRGHNEPGGGFVGGLIATMAFALYTFAHGIQNAKKIFPLQPTFFITLGLILALGSVLVPLIIGKPAGTGLWGTYEFPLIGPASTILIFDIGVYFVVFGATISIVFTIKQN